MVDRRDLRGAGDGAAGEGRFEQLGEADVLAQASFDERDQMPDPRELVLDHQLRPMHTAGLAHTGEIVPLQVDDHHVLGCVLP